MFTFDTVIDSIQAAKKQMISAFVADAKFKTELTQLVDSQTEFAKGSVKSSVAIAEAFATHAKDQMLATSSSFTKAKSK